MECLIDPKNIPTYNGNFKLEFNYLARKHRKVSSSSKLHKSDNSTKPTYRSLNHNDFDKI